MSSPRYSITVQHSDAASGKSTMVSNNNSPTAELAFTSSTVNSSINNFTNLAMHKNSRLRQGRPPGRLAAAQLRISAGAHPPSPGRLQQQSATVTFRFALPGFSRAATPERHNGLGLKQEPHPTATYPNYHGTTASKAELHAARDFLFLQLAIHLSAVEISDDEEEDVAIDKHLSLYDYDPSSASDIITESDECLDFWSSQPLYSRDMNPLRNEKTLNTLPTLEDAKSPKKRNIMITVLKYEIYNYWNTAEQSSEIFSSMSLPPSLRSSGITLTHGYRTRTGSSLGFLHHSTESNSELAQNTRNIEILINKVSSRVAGPRPHPRLRIYSEATNLQKPALPSANGGNGYQLWYCPAPVGQLASPSKL
ncbi:hypothetical protein BJ742DRAFT_739719 [Cladochytrium replicatum]|nr:hypothetical protein BJ742DRAFT_739719 [Cladochytrium replicatum]